MAKINVSQICKIFNGSCFIKEFAGGDQLIMKCMIKGVFDFALRRFVPNFWYIMVDLYQTKLITKKGASRSKHLKKKKQKKKKKRKRI